MEKEILHTNDAFNVVKKDGRFGVEPNKLSVVVMPYTTVRGLPETIGIMEEINPFREGGKSLTLVTGSSNEEDPDILSTAQRKLKEEAGFDVIEPDRWSFLGFLTTGKHSASSSPCFACDVTGIEATVSEAGDENAPKSKFMMSPAKDALDTDDCYIPAVFMKIFRYIFGYAGSQDDTDTIKTKTTAKQPLADDVKEEVLKIEGVKGIGVNQDNQINVYVNNALSDKAKEKLDTIFTKIDQSYTVENVADEPK